MVRHNHFTKFPDSLYKPICDVEINKYIKRTKQKKKNFFDISLERSEEEKKKIK
jgi:hypothetical protein